MIQINKIGLQLVFWLLLLGVNFVFISHMVPFPKSLLFLANTTFFTGLLFYGNIFYLFPKYSDTNSNRKFLLVSIFAVFILAFCFGYIDMLLFEEYRIEAPKKFKYPFLPSFIKSLFWLMLIQMISTIAMLQDGLRKKSEETKVVVEEKLNTELKYLKAQINPHFLFNALNNIYSLSYMKSDKGPDAVLKLSGMLRYVLEDCQADHVRLGSEIEYIENFIEFQQMKTPDLQNIVFFHKQIDKSMMMAPMLLITFIENSFKYSKIENHENAYVIIELKTEKGALVFIIKNSIPLSGKSTHGTGKGIENVKHRLSILYPQMHELLINESENEFVVTLKIKH